MSHISITSLNQVSFIAYNIPLSFWSSRDELVFDLSYEISPRRVAAKFLFPLEYHAE